jgi:hypothetical protein
MFTSDLEKNMGKKTFRGIYEQKLSVDLPQAKKPTNSEVCRLSLFNPKTAFL